jgi:hypothetical protein
MAASCCHHHHRRPASAMAGSVLPARHSSSRIGGGALLRPRSVLLGGGGAAARPLSAPAARASAAPHHPTDAASAAALGAYARGLPKVAPATPEATAAASTSVVARLLPTATLTRIFLSSPATSGSARSALAGGGGGALNSGAQRSSATGPLSLLLVLLALATAALAAVRSAVARRVRACGTCRGFGVARCRLCQGSGRVDWTAKLSHYDVCPLCMNRRFVSCSDCGGAHGARPLFAHLKRRAGGELFEGVTRPAANDEDGESEQQQQQQQRQGAFGYAMAPAGGVPAAGVGSSSGASSSPVPLVSQQGTRGPVLAFAAAAVASLSSLSSSDEDDTLARQPTGAASSRKRAQKIRDSAGGLAAFSVPASAAAPAGIGSAMMD